MLIKLTKVQTEGLFIRNNVPKISSDKTHVKSYSLSYRVDTSLGLDGDLLDLDGELSRYLLLNFPTFLDHFIAIFCVATCNSLE